jgi:hypothetical protein
MLVNVKGQFTWVVGSRNPSRQIVWLIAPDPQNVDNPFQRERKKKLLQGARAIHFLSEKKGDRGLYIMRLPSGGVKGIPPHGLE